MLTCEDAYCDKNDHPSVSKRVDNLPSAQDLLGLAVANMYYSTYALGEGYDYMFFYRTLLIYFGLGMNKRWQELG